MIPRKLVKGSLTLIPVLEIRSSRMLDSWAPARRFTIEIAFLRVPSASKKRSRSTASAR